MDVRKLRERIKDRGLSSREMADITNVSESTIQKMMRGTAILDRTVNSIEQGLDKLDQEYINKHCKHLK
jgi:transcriptional regulator with XRE-family HTH domain